MHRAAVWQEAATQILKLFKTLLSISCGFNLITLLMMSSLCLWIFFTNSVFQVPPQKILSRVEMLGIGWLGGISLTRNESVPWEVMHEVFKCSVREILNTSSEKKSHGFHKKCSIEFWTILIFELLLPVIQQRGAWNEHSINCWKSIVKHYWF